MAPTPSTPINCPMTPYDGPTTIIRRYSLSPSVHTFLPRAENPDGEPSQPHHRHTRPFTSPIEIVLLIGIVAIFVGLIYYFVYLGIVACYSSIRKEQKRRKDFPERAGESAKDRAERFKKWKEDREEDGEDLFESAKSKIQDGYETTKKKVKDGYETTKKKAKDTAENGKKGAKDQAENAKMKAKDSKNKQKKDQKDSGNWNVEGEDEFNKIGETVKEWYEEGVKKTQEFFDSSKTTNHNTGEQTPLIDKAKDKADSATKKTKRKAKKGKESAKDYVNADGASDQNERESDDSDLMVMSPRVHVGGPTGIEDCDHQGKPIYNLRY